MFPLDPHRHDQPDAAVGPKKVGPYQKLRVLGNGGMSEVFLCYDSRAGQPVAVKLMSGRLAEDPQQTERFRRETSLCLKLSHPNIVRGLDSGKDPETKRRYLVLEYVDGPSALTLLERRRRLEINDVMHIGIAITRALAYLHERNYVHRDIKPDNILLSPCGRAKLIDLGLVRMEQQDSAQLTATADGLGTSYYMPFEQGINAHWVDGRSDIFALGATMYHLVTGRVPFPGSDHHEIMRMKNEGHFSPASVLNPDVPAELELILNRMMARNPRDRYPNCMELLADLQGARLRRGLPSYADLGMAVQSPQSEKETTPQPTRPDLRLRASQLRRSRNGDMWIIRYQDEKHAWVVRKATTSQLLKAVKKGRFAGPVFGARRPRQKFRPLGEFPEFLPYIQEHVPARGADSRRRGLCGRLLARIGLGLFGAGLLAAIATCGHLLLS